MRRIWTLLFRSPGLVLTLLASAALAIAGCTTWALSYEPTLTPSEPTAAAPTSTSAQATTAPTPEPTAIPPTAVPPPEPVLPPGVISGVVRDAEGPVEGATVRVQLTEYEATTAADGTFTLNDLTMTKPVSVTAWAFGYYVGWTDGTPGLIPVTITLKPYYTTDNLDYEWFSFDGIIGSASCAPCHPSYEEWAADAHGQSAVNPRFLTMYEGTDVHGNRSPLTEYTGGDARSADPDAPYYGPGYRLDFPDRTGNCAACHTPVASNIDPDDACTWSGCHTELTGQRSSTVPDPIALPSDVHGVSPTDLTGNGADGVGCDFCF